MPRIDQLSANEASDDFTGQPLGEGFLEMRTSAGNRVLFKGPAEYNAFRIANPASDAGTPNTGLDYNNSDQTPTST